MSLQKTRSAKADFPALTSHNQVTHMPNERPQFLLDIIGDSVY